MNIVLGQTEEYLNGQVSSLEKQNFVFQCFDVFKKLNNR